MKRNERGITLIALVVTIVVLLILAGVSISMLTGENGIIKQASNAKDSTEQAKVEELVDLAINSLIGENQGSTNGITPEMIANEINKMENRSDVYAKENTFPTKIMFPDEKREVEIDLPQKENLDKIYNENIEESQIAPTEIFDYEIISEAEMSAVNLNNLPTKEVRITRIKPEYCNFGGYNPDTGNSITDTNYEITLKDGTKIEDLLIIPYQVEGKYVENGIDGEIYKITEVNTGVYWNDGQKNGYGIPNNIKKIIYPNTVKKITGNVNQFDETETISQIILPNNLKEIGDYAIHGYKKVKDITIPTSVTRIGDGAFQKCWDLTNIIIPSSVTSIGKFAFSDCFSLTNIIIPNSVTRIEDNTFSGSRNLTSVTIPASVKTIGKYAFSGCWKLTNVTIPTSVTSIEKAAFKNTGLTDITIPNSVTSIGSSAFSNCSSLTNITIPNNVTSIERYTFYYCDYLESITIPSSVTSIGEYSFDRCDSLTTVNYTGTKAQWNAISIGSRNVDLTNATIHCIDGDINA